ncbi:MAG: YedE family putative selenium transporter [Coriobacteriia bacterium]|nr:YedE family putative selenium transporter [Coriobacteriia bacterium]
MKNNIDKKNQKQNLYQLIALLVTGALIAVLAILLTALGNPGNMGFCAACFLRDIAGAIGLHGNPLVQYARPEILGVVLGVFAVALVRREFKAQGGSAPLTRFILGFTMMIGALIFLGCPLRMLLRIAGGDLNAIVGLFGFVAGILLGLFFIKRGFSLGRKYNQKAVEGVHLPAASLVLLWIVVFVPSLLLFSAEGPGSMHAPLLAALVAGIAAGVASFVSRFCIVGAFRDSFLLKKVTPTLMGVVALLVVALVGNLVLGNFQLGFAGQPVAHTEAIWNFLGLALVGLSAVLVSGCPMRQLVLAGGGSSDATITIAGMLAGAAIAHNFGIAASPAGVTTTGAVGFGFALLVTLVIAVVYTFMLAKNRVIAKEEVAAVGEKKGLCAQDD